MIHAGRHTTPPWQNTHTHTHICMSQTVHFNANTCSPLFWEKSLAAFSPLYHMEDLDCIVSSRAEPSSLEYIQRIACLNWFIEFYVKYPAVFALAFCICTLFMQEDAVMLIVNDVYLHCLKCIVQFNCLASQSCGIVMLIYGLLYTVCLQHYRWGKILPPSQRAFVLKRMEAPHFIR